MTDSDNSWSPSIINKQLRKRLENHESAKVTNLDSQPCIAVNMHSGKNLTFDGDAGDNFGGMNNGSNIVLNGDAGRFVGNGMNNGEIIINGNCKEGVGHCQSGGTIVIQGSAENEAAPSMKGGDLIISGNVNGDLGTCMSGGNLIVCGDVLGNIGKIMTGGKIFISGKFDETDNLDVSNISPSDWKALQKTLQNHGVNPNGLNFRSISSNYKSMKPEKKENENSSITDTLILVQATLSRRPRTVGLDKIKMGLSIGKNKKEPLNLTIPLLWNGNNAPIYADWEINQESPSNLDSANVAIINLVSTDISRRLDMQRSTDLAFVVELIRQSTAKRIPIMVKLNAGEVENDMEMISKSGADGVILMSKNIPLEAAVTATRKIKSDLIILATCDSLDSENIAKIISLGASGMFLENNCSNKDLKEFGTKLANTVGSLGVGSLAELGPEHLRTNNQNTAAMTGVPLAGYESVLPMWRH